MRRDRDIIHIPPVPRPRDPVGKSPIEIARIALEAAEAEQDFHRSCSGQRHPTGIIQVQDKTQAEVDEIQKRIDEKAKEGKRLPRVMSNATFQQITINPADAQFLEARQFSVQEVARLFGIPGLFLGVTTGDSLTYSTTESLFRLFVTGTLRPTYLERIEQAFTRLLVRGKAARFNISELLRADIKARYEAYQIGLAAGFLTKNEVRRTKASHRSPAETRSRHAARPLGGRQCLTSSPPSTPPRRRSRSDRSNGARSPAASSPTT
jgi:Phage-related protein